MSDSGKLTSELEIYRKFRKIYTLQIDVKHKMHTDVDVKFMKNWVSNFSSQINFQNIHSDN